LNGRFCHDRPLMYLKELRLHGFKSFADPTRLEFQAGVTAIVGPNGCGKSNIADAIRWVLGEQSAKSLRAGAMQDVIFQGTTTRKPVNLCEVTLVFTDCEQQLGTAWHEVEVTRRVVREGGSEYLLNGKSCRLKDIQRLFLDTGVGQVSYSFMLQGQIDQVLSSNPSERRAIFEEAAGISKYKTQRREALNRLAQVDTNLARVTDVIEEVARQIGSLRRQAAKALRYKRIHHRLKHLDLALNVHRWTEARAAIRELEDKSAGMRTTVTALEAELATAESGLAARRQQRTDLANQLQNWQQAVFALRGERDNSQSRVEMAALRQQDLQQRIAALEHEIAEMAEQQRLVAERLAGESRVRQQQLELFGSSDEVFQEKNNELAAIQQKQGDAELEVSRARQLLLVKEGALTRLRAHCTTLEVDLKTYQVRHANLTEELHLLHEESAVLEQDMAQFQHLHGQRQKERGEQEARITEYQQTSKELLDAFRELQRRIAETDRKAAGLQARMGVLEGLQARFEGFSEGAKAILQGRLAAVIDAADYRLLLKHLEIGEGFSLAAETLLGAAADSLFITDMRRVMAVATHLRDGKLGRASLMVAPPDSAAGQQAASRRHQAPQAVPPGLQPATALIRSRDPAIAAFLERYLTGCYCADSADGFVTWWLQHPEFEFHTVVTREGELIDHRGVLLVGSLRAAGNDGSFLERENQIHQIQAELVRLHDQHETFKMQADQLQGKLDALERKTEDQRRLVAELAGEVTTLATQHQNARKQVDQNMRTIESRRLDLERLESGRDESAHRLEKAASELAATEAEITAQKQAIAAAEANLEAVRGEREAMREHFNEIRLEIAQKKQRLELLDRGMEELQTKAREIEALRLRRSAEIGQLREQISELTTESESHGARQREIEARLAAVMEQLERDRLALKEVETAIQEVEQGFAGKRENHDRLARELNALDVELARKQTQTQFVAEEILREHNAFAAEVSWQEQLWFAGDPLPERIKVAIEDEAPEDFELSRELPDPTAADLERLATPDWTQIQDEVESLRSRLASIGAVNLGAIDEYKELKQRHDFLKTQSDDLWQAKDQLLQAIDEINTTSKKLFVDTFDQIRKNFLYTFETLFGGGHADLVLVDTADILESGIDITAQPPGTRLRSLALLSGGQKTMTAVALLFAIYMVKPSPFCVLDEIDAPLDDANIGRFTNMLERFLEYSQFLIITHNKRTIRVADTIYGATMPEKGVSRVVSMRFNKATGEAETP
jgi:chromosome segregation protein